MSLIPDFREKFPKLWSVRLALVAALFSGIEVVLPFFEHSMPRGVFALVSFLFTIAAVVARAIAQPKLSQD